MVLCCGKGVDKAGTLKFHFGAFSTSKFHFNPFIRHKKYLSMNLKELIEMRIAQLQKDKNYLNNSVSIY